MQFILLDDLDSGSIIGLSVVGLFVCFVVLFLIIQGGTRANTLVRLAKIQAMLLREIARKQGVEEETIKKIESTE